MDLAFLCIGIYLLYLGLVIFYQRKLVWQMKNIFKGKTQDDQVKQNWVPFLRHNILGLSILEMNFVAAFIMPFRIICIILACMIFVFFSLFIGQQKRVSGQNTSNQNEKDYNSYQEYTKSQRFWLYLAIHIPQKLLFLGLGVWNIQTKLAKIQDYDKDYPSQNYQENNQKPSILIGNHVGLLEIIYISHTKYFPSFIAQKKTLKIPFIGKAARATQCIFVDRKSDFGRQDVKEQISQRCNKIKRGINLQPLAMFPEGTTTNGDYLLKFKKGAFEPIMPIKIYYFRFKNQAFKSQYDFLPFFTHLFMLMSQLSNNFEVTEFDTYFPEHLNLKDSVQWEIYSDKIRDIMQKYSKNQLSEQGHRDAVEYDNFMKKLYRQVQKDPFKLDNLQNKLFKELNKQAKSEGINNEKDD